MFRIPRTARIFGACPAGQEQRTPEKPPGRRAGKIRTGKNNSGNFGKAIDNPQKYDRIICVPKPLGYRMMRNCVRVARQSLNLFVAVRIRVPQPEKKQPLSTGQRLFLFQQNKIPCGICEICLTLNGRKNLCLSFCRKLLAVLTPPYTPFCRFSVFAAHTKTGI